MEKVVAFGFMFCACIAVFVGVHKEDIEKGEFDQVVTSYIEG